MNQTVLITGTSSGYGKATAELFLDRGWNVIATMRQPKPDIFGSQSDRLKVLPLDVTNSGSVERRPIVGLEEGTAAGYGWIDDEEVDRTRLASAGG